MWAEDEQQFAHFATQGESVVRRLAESGGYPLGVQHAAFRWLAQREIEANRVEQAFKAELAETASRAAVVAERAAAAAETQADAAREQARIAKQALITAIAATIIAALALIVSILVALHVMR